MSAAAHALLFALLWWAAPTPQKADPAALAPVEVAVVESTAAAPPSAMAPPSALSRGQRTRVRTSRTRASEAAPPPAGAGPAPGSTPAPDRAGGQPAPGPAELRLTLPQLAPDRGQSFAPLDQPARDRGGGDEAGRVGPRIPQAPNLGLWGPTPSAEPPVDHSRFTKKVLADGRVQLDERPRVETLPERQQYIRETSRNRVHTAIDDTSHGTSWLWGGEPTTTGDGDRIDYQGKKRFLEQTFSERTVMAGAARAHDEQLALAQLPARLEALWSDSSRPPALRRQLIYELWAECDPALQSGRAARARIEVFVRARLPAASPSAFSADELARLNRGRSERFDPYR
ncbi:MAG TPA: hypothetical protein VKN99_05720 [Polyangia bacterium]|nr:hypothetical protein [Polyangia bacterium]